MNYNLDGICQDCIYLDKIKPLFEEKDKEIERLNHIINELEKWLKEHSIIDYECSATIIHEQIALSYALRYLKELKEGK